MIKVEKETLENSLKWDHLQLVDHIKSVTMAVSTNTETSKIQTFFSL